MKILIGLRKVVSNRCKVKRVELEKGVFLCENFATIATNALLAENLKMPNYFICILKPMQKKEIRLVISLIKNYKWFRKNAKKKMPNHLFAY